MVLGFAVIAVFAVAVFSTIVATVNEMKKPPAPTSPQSDHRQLIPHPHRFSTLSPNSTYTRITPFDQTFDGTDDQLIDENHGPNAAEPLNQAELDAGVAESQEYEDYDEEEDREVAQSVPRRQQQAMRQRNPFTPPAFPSSGYGTVGLGQSSAGLNPANKAFIPFFGYVDPVVLIAIVAFPVLCTLGVTSLLMPIIPIVIYIIGLIFPSTKRYRNPSFRINSRMRQVMDLGSGSFDSYSGSDLQTIEQILRTLSHAMDKF